LRENLFRGLFDPLGTSPREKEVVLQEQETFLYPEEVLLQGDSSMGVAFSTFPQGRIYSGDYLIL